MIGTVIWMALATPCCQIRVDENATKTELSKLDGTWTVFKVEFHGRSLEKGPEVKLIIKNGKVYSKDGADSPKATEDPFDLAKILDTSKKPKTLTLPWDDNKSKFYAIYDLEGDEFRVCGDLVRLDETLNPEDRRPKEIDSNKGLLIIFKRVKK